MLNRCKVNPPLQQTPIPKVEWLANPSRLPFLDYLRCLCPRVAPPPHTPTPLRSLFNRVPLLDIYPSRFPSLSEGLPAKSVVFTKVDHDGSRVEGSLKLLWAQLTGRPCRVIETVPTRSEFWLFASHAWVTSSPFPFHLPVSPGYRPAHFRMQPLPPNIVVSLLLSSCSHVSSNFLTSFF